MTKKLKGKIVTHEGHRMYGVAIKVENSLHYLFGRRLRGKLQEGEYQAVYLSWFSVLNKTHKMLDETWKRIPEDQAGASGKARPKVGKDSKLKLFTCRTDLGEMAFKLSQTIDKLTALVEMLGHRKDISIELAIDILDSFRAQLDHLEQSVQDLQEICRRV